MKPGVLVSQLYAKHLGVPIIVIGGGPSAPDQWEWIRTRVSSKSIVISANGHAWQLDVAPDYIFCKDHEHTEKKVPMESLLRAYQTPIVTPHYWGDYRAVNWPIQGNSGQMAIALGALMGGWPVIPIGIDCFQGATYFHDPDVKNVSLGRPHGYWKGRMDRLMGRLDGAVIRGLDGITAQVFGKFSRSEALPKPIIPPIFERYKGERTYYAETLRAFSTPYDRRVEIPAGQTIPVCEHEAITYPKNGVARLVGPPPSYMDC